MKKKEVFSLYGAKKEVKYIYYVRHSMKNTHKYIQIQSYI